ncbi:hypothetical protein A3Q56_01047 [Intoshia linei]|uniref:Uncharacterized protein n=1 Tax=Intoshia linei TaxID=1819745 RepID=A0A177BA56_9BILA|nr:hypothetical protein A3Q56_01047 [Intoshia linei]
MSDEQIDVKPTLKIQLPLPQFSRSGIKTCEKLIRIWSESSPAAQTDQVKLIIFNFEISLQDLLLEDELPINVDKLITQVKQIEGLTAQSRCDSIE